MLDTTVRIPDGVTLSGAGLGLTVLTHDFDGPAIEARNVSNVRLSDLSIRSTAKNIRLRELPEHEAIAEEDWGDRYLHWGIVFFDACAEVSAENVEISGTRDAERLRGLVAHFCTGLSLTKLTVQGMDGSAVTLFSSSGCGVESCKLGRTGGNGLGVAPSVLHPNLPSRAVLRDNACYENTGAGIVLWSSDSDEISGNQCWGNSANGIALTRQDASPDDPSRAVLRDNACYENTGAGISLLSSESDEISGNQCWGNSTNGIDLARSEASPDHPSRAVLRDNACYENTGEGIVLWSSDSDEISCNQCWGNSNSGISLNRSPESPDDPSRAVLRDNACYENTGAGIMLWSSESDEISGNQCWGNSANGIGLDRSDASPDDPSRAVLRDNACYENTGAGIVLWSSDSDEISGNQCWGNSNSGISLNRSPESPDDPSRAVLRDNACYENVGSGIVLWSSESDEISGNQCWGNEWAGIRLGRRRSVDEPSRATLSRNILAENQFSIVAAIGDFVDGEGNQAFRNGHAPRRLNLEGFGGGPLDLDVSTRPISDEELLELKREGLPATPLARLLEAKGIEQPDTLARFLIGRGALGDLKKWLGVEPEPPQDKAAPDIPDGGTFELREVRDPDLGGTPVIRMKKISGKGLRSAVWDRVARHVVNDKPGVHVIGAFGDHGTDIDRLIEEFPQVNGFDLSRAKTGAEIPSGRSSLISHLPASGQRLGRPLVYDCTKRSADALAKEPVGRPFLEPEPPSGKRFVIEWLRFVLGSRKLMSRSFGVVALVFAVAVCVGWWKGFETPFADPLGAISFALAANVLDFQFADVLEIVLSLAAGLGVTAAVFWLNKFVPSHLRISLRTSDPLPRARREGPWKEWVRRRVFGSGSINLIVLRDQQEWFQDDRVALNEILGMCPEDETLIVVVEAPTRAQLDRSLFRALSDAEDELSGPDRVEVVACLGPEPELLNLDTIGEGTEVEGLLGLRKAEPARAERVKATILVPDFTVSDLIPMLALGSTYMNGFEISRLADERFSKFGPEFSEKFSGFGRVFEGRSDFRADLEKEVERLNAWIDEARDADACVLYKDVENRTTTYHVIGRYQRRQALIEALATDRDLFAGTPADLRDYVHGMLTCGYIAALEKACDALIDDGRHKVSAAAAFSALYSALILRKELGAMSQSDHDRRLVFGDPVLNKALSAVDGCALPIDAQDLMGAKLYALSRHFRTDKFEPTEPKSGGAGKAFGKEISKCERLFDSLDRTLARQVADRRLQPLMRLLPVKDRDLLIEYIDKLEKRGRHLAAYFGTSKTAEDVVGVFKDHQAMSDDAALATLLSQMARAIENEEQGVSFASFLDEHKVHFTEFSGKAKSQGYAANPELGFYDLLGALATCLETRNRNAPNMIEGSDDTFSHYDLMFGNLAELDDSARKLHRIELVSEFQTIQARVQ